MQETKKVEVRGGKRRDRSRCNDRLQLLCWFKVLRGDGSTTGTNERPWQGRVLGLVGGEDIALIDMYRVCEENEAGPVVGLRRRLDLWTWRTVLYGFFFFFRHPYIFSRLDTMSHIRGHRLGFNPP